MNDQAVKPAHSVQVGDHLTVKKNGIYYQYEILKIIEKRVGAPIAQTCYTDHTPDEELHKFEQWYLARRGAPEYRDKGLGRPTKRDRRQIDRLKDQ